MPPLRRRLLNSAQARAAAAAKPLCVETLDRYFTELASAEPTPGGGSAATIVASAGASLVAMVARICEKNPKFAAHHEAAHYIATKADALRGELTSARERDERAFARVIEAQNLPRGTEAETAERKRALEMALHSAAQAPLRACKLCLDVLHLAEQTLEFHNRTLASDVGCAAEFGFAAVAACAYNVRINHRYMKDADAVHDQSSLLVGYENEARTILGRIRHAVAGALAG